MSKINEGDTVRCTDALCTNGRLVTGQTYQVRKVSTTGSHVGLEGRSGMYRVNRFTLVEKAKAKPTPFGQVRAVTVNKSDIHDVLTQYVRFGLGINATVEKIVEKFPEAIELVLTHEVTA